MDLIAVVMKAPTSAIRFKNASSLLDYGFTNFECKKLISKDEIVKTISINKGIQPATTVVADSDCGVILNKGTDINIEQSISIPDNINAPILKGDVIGKLNFILNGETISECNLIANENVNKINLFSMNSFILNNWLSILRF